ncbi:MAG TPA: glycoside hydrolase family 2 TIM barrel-domain containing protein [Chthonomonadaceae bacterium]|nr:glycoside hydrolase family 2 TIM barrel-domain containing protein [Chthonomonadaceae bacterium]
MRHTPATDPPHSEAPRPASLPAGGAEATLRQLRPRICLDGEWTFQFGDEQPQTIAVPAPWESQRNDLVNRAGTAVYERTFTVPDHFEGRRVLLQFDAVDYFTEVWINGIPVGVHEGGYTPFAFPIEKALHGYGPDVVHTVLVRVTDSTVEQDAVLPNGEALPFAEIPHGKQSWYSSVGGIWQSVHVEARAATHIARVAFYPDIDAGRAKVFLALEGFGESVPPGWQVRVGVDAPRGAGAVETFILPITGEEPREDGLICLEKTFPVPEARLWSPDTPHLYSSLVTLEYDGEVEDAISERFGMRKVEAKEGRIWLNNQPLFLIGALDQDFYPRTIYTPPSEEYLRDQFRKAKEIGLNLMRHHIKVPTKLYLDLCDEMGLLVWCELPNGARLSPAFRERARKTLEEMWQQNANHPCCVIITIMNESWGIDLNDSEQRRWLAATYRWMKEMASTWLVVDNSACIPNFHVISDLDDYHVYFNIPDQADDFAEWVEAFSDREAGTYTGYGDAEYRRVEPLLISEFGNWGLPRVEDILQAEGGIPYWFKTGDGPARPNKVLERFEKQELGRAYKDYNDLAASSQEQEWLSLKWEIEQMRLHPEVAGYVITEFTDVNWECNGLLEMTRRPKVFHHRLKDLQTQDILIPRLMPRTAFWEGETAALSVSVSCFSGCSVLGGMLSWEVEGLPELRGEEPARLVGPIADEPVYGSYQIAQFWITAPPVPAPAKHVIHLTLRDAEGRTLAYTTQNIVFVPAGHRSIGRGKTVWLYDPLGSAIGLTSLLTSTGFRIAAQPEAGALGLVTRWDPTVSAFLHGGGKAVLVATHTKSITIASGLGVRLLERNTNGWWGDWCTSKIWFVPEHFPSLPDTFRFDFEYRPIVPERVLTGPMPENITAGLFVGWLHNPAALVARLPIGKGDLVVTTFDLLSSIGSDPIATLLLNDLFAMPPAIRL